MFYSSIANDRNKKLFINFYMCSGMKNIFLNVKSQKYKTFSNKYFNEMHQICVEPVFIKLVAEELIHWFNYSKEHICLIWNGLMPLNDFKCQFINLHTSLENRFCSERGICFKITFVVTTVNELKPRQKQKCRSATCSKMESSFLWSHFPSRAYI